MVSAVGATIGAMPDHADSSVVVAVFPTLREKDHFLGLVVQCALAYPDAPVQLMHRPNAAAAAARLKRQLVRRGIADVRITLLREEP